MVQCRPMRVEPEGAHVRRMALAGAAGKADLWSTADSVTPLHPPPSSARVSVRAKREAPAAVTNRQPPTTKSNVNVFKIQNALGVADQPKRERRVGGARLRGPVYTAVELKTTRSNAQEPVNIAYGLYVFKNYLPRYGRSHKSE